MFKRENNAGLYLTVAFHLLLLIILLASRIDFLLSEESSFILDFTKEELIKEIEKKEQLKEDVSKELDEILSGREAVRNVVVDESSRKGSQLKDDRFRNPNQVYDEAKRLQERLDAAKKEAEANSGSDNVINPDKKEEVKKESYKGPSVVSYLLEGRKSMSLPIPVYKCVGGGDVAVSIVVNRKGYVISATVIPDRSSGDKCLGDYAIKAAKSSRFTASSSAPERQTGEIVYRFIAQ
ncbi:MAG: energy transducer TonB [Bacteroidales bacterium]